ncbi:MAG: universal stress protein [Microthrixaceae bacterium]|jgi:nucleotide-binding universal stress UspA family protein|nr:universal stress protein [Microthrixaceae bacterium]
MDRPLLLCADGSHHSNLALRAGIDLVGTDGPMIVLTVVHEPDPMLVTGTGIAGGVMSAEAFDAQVKANAEEGERLAREVASELGLDAVEIRVLAGEPGAQILAFAEEVHARGVVLGTRGHGGLRRALLGSVSDHIVRHATCPVIITSHPEEAS